MIVLSVVVVFLLQWLPGIWSMLKKLAGILSPFIYGFVMAYLLIPVFNALYKRTQPRFSQRMKTVRASPKGCAAS